MNYLNIIILIYLLGMAYWWSTQGLYSSLIHLLAVIIAGAFAFAIWEPLTLGLFMSMSPMFAWPVGLLVPFLFFLLLLRLVSNRYLKSNVHFSSLVNSIFGGLLGIVSGVLSIGIFVLGISFLPLGPSLLGYQPLHVLQHGQIEGQIGSLWVPVDTMTAGFYSMLSSGAFSSGEPMRVYQPQLARQAALYRMSYAVNASPAADPSHITIQAMATSPTPLQTIDDSVIAQIGDEARTAGNKLVVIDTQWQHVTGVFDGDSTLRVSPTQIRLIVTRSDDSTVLVPPVGASKPMPGAPRQYVPFNDDKTYIWGGGQEVTLAFAFIIKQDDRPRFILIRHTRMDLPQTPDEPATTSPDDHIRELAGVAPGTLAPLVTPTDGGPTPLAHTGPDTGQSVLDIVLSNKLPEAISKNVVQGFTYGADDESGIVSGQGTARRVNTSLTKEVIADHIQTPSHQRTLRVLLNREKARSVFGAARVAAAQLNGIWLVDKSGNKWYPVGYVLQKANGSQKIRVDLGAPLQSAKELPLAELDPNDKLYLYFSVSRGVTIVSYNVGAQTTPVNVEVPG